MSDVEPAVSDVEPAVSDIERALRLACERIAGTEVTIWNDTMSPLRAGPFKASAGGFIANGMSREAALTALTLRLTAA